ncbi:ribulose-phosphate 3-epimerase [Candidatus Omnitrophota bacterium]
MKIKVAPSVLSADFSRLADEIKRVEVAGADMLHIDVMDGCFVPNVTIGPCVVRSIRNVTKLPLDVHLMVEKPQDLLDGFIDAGSDMITLHIETISGTALKEACKKLKAKGIKRGISLNPGTPLERIKEALDIVDFVLVMSVNPGFSGQKFMPEVVPKIKELRSIFGGDIAVDGGMNDENAKEVIKAGANIIAAGSYIFGSSDVKSSIKRIKDAGKE